MSEAFQEDLPRETDATVQPEIINWQKQIGGGPPTADTGQGKV